MFPQICEKCCKRKHSHIYLVFNNIESYLSVFVIFIWRLRSVISCEWEIKSFCGLTDRIFSDWKLKEKQIANFNMGILDLFPACSLLKIHIKNCFKVVNSLVRGAPKSLSGLGKPKLRDPSRHLTWFLALPWRCFILCWQKNSVSILRHLLIIREIFFLFYSHNCRFPLCSVMWLEGSMLIRWETEPHEVRNEGGGVGDRICFLNQFSASDFLKAEITAKKRKTHKKQIRKVRVLIITD